MIVTPEEVSSLVKRPFEKINISPKKKSTCDFHPYLGYLIYLGYTQLNSTALFISVAIIY